MHVAACFTLWNVHDSYSDSRDDVTNKVAWLVVEDPANDGQSS